MTEVVNRILNALTGDLYARLICYDLSHAFDTIAYNLLIKSYLCERRQYVAFSSKKSAMMTEGFILGSTTICVRQTQYVCMPLTSYW